MRQTQKTEKKDNRKSILLIALLLLLVAIIGFGGYTLSKYITSKETTGTAQVAKWGFNIEADNSKLFGSEYKWNENATASTTDGTGTVTVKADTANTRNLVAPGTTGSMTFSITGKAEVLAQVKMEMKNVKDITLTYNTDQVYNPVKWTLTKNGQAVVTDGTLAAVAESLNKQYNDTTAQPAVDGKYAPNTEINDVYVLTWKWAFEVDETTDKLDTLLAAFANDNGYTTDGTYTVVEADTVTEIAFDLSISVVQLQK